MRYCLRQATSDIFVVRDSTRSFAFRYAKLYMCLTVALYGSTTNAGDYFDPAFLSDTPSKVADLSKFETEDVILAGTYRLDLYVNDKFVDTRDIVFEASSVAGNGGLVPCFTREDMDTFDINPAAVPGLADILPGACVQLAALINTAKSTLTLERLRLDVSVPQAVLVSRARGFIPVDQWDNGISALLVNYNLTGAHTSGTNMNTSNSYFLNLNSGLNIGAWRLRNNSTLSDNNRYKSGSGASWKTLDSYVQRALPGLKSSVMLGDVSTSSTLFNNFSFRGARLYSDDNMLASSERGFAPVVRGIANSNAEVTIQQNGSVIYQTYVAAGPFAINDIYATSSNGDLLVSVVEADGRVNSYTVPYSSLPILQREGRFKYDLAAGKYRNAVYQTNPNVLEGTMAYGLPSGMTLYGGLQNSENYQSYSLGLGQNFGSWGAASVDITTASSILADDSKHNGYSLRMLYAKTLTTSGTNLQLAGYQYSTRGFYNLSDTTSKLMESKPTIIGQDGEFLAKPVLLDAFNLKYARRSSTQLTIAQPLGDFGSLYTFGSRQTFWNTSEVTDLLQAGYQINRKGVNYNLSYNYNKSAWGYKTDQIFALSISMPLGDWVSATTGRPQSNRMSASYGQSVSKDGHARYNVGVNGTALENRSLNYSAQQSYSDKEHLASSNVSAQFRGASGTANVGYNYSGQNSRLNYGLSGGIVAHENGVTLSQPLGSTNVLVKAPRARDVIVSNGVGIKTDRRGYAVVPSASTYRENRIALDTRSLANNIELDNAVAYVVPTQGALVRAEFDVRVGVRAMMSLTYKGQPVPFGASVTQADNKNDNIVGNNGQVFLTGLAMEGQLGVRWQDGPDGQCTVNYQLDEEAETKKISKLAAECV